MNPHIILGVHVTDRLKNAAMVQALFTEYGSHIRTRLGLHEVDGTPSAPNGVVLLELVGNAAKCEELATRLGAIEGVDVQRMVFSHK